MSESRVQHLCCGRWFDTPEQEMAHRANDCPFIEESKRRYREEGPTTVEIDGKLITARIPAWDDE